MSDDGQCWTSEATCGRYTSPSRHMRRCSLLIAPEIRPLDEGDQIEYASARFEAAAVIAAEKKKAH